MGRGMLCAAALMSITILGGRSSATHPAESDPRWQQAATLQDQGNYTEAAALFQEIFADYPTSQRTGLRVAICLERAGQTDAAATSYEVANAVEPFGYWAEVGVYYEALVHRQRGDPAAAWACIEALRDRFPDSRWTAQGEVLGAELDGRDPTPERAALARELAAWERLRLANRRHEPEFDQQRLRMLRAVVADFSDTGTALQALDTIGHIQIRNGLSAEAITTFLEVIQRAEPVAPQSRVVETALTRLAALYHASGQRTEALQLFTRLADHASDPAVVSNAALQAAGLYFELRQAEQDEGQVVPCGYWDEVRSMCDRVKTLDFAKPGETARAELMILESYHWEGRPAEALEAAEQFIAAHDPATYRSEVATAHLVAGECLQVFRRHSEALVHYRWIASEFGEEEVWSGLTNLQRTYYRVYDALVRGGAPHEEVTAAADLILARWPDSEYADMIRATRQRASGQ